MDRLLLTVNEVAESLGLSRSKTYDLISKGQIRSVKLGRSRRITAEALAEFVEDLACSREDERVRM